MANPVAGRGVGSIVRLDLDGASRSAQIKVVRRLSLAEAHRLLAPLHHGTVVHRLAVAHFLVVVHPLVLHPFLMLHHRAVMIGGSLRLDVLSAMGHRNEHNEQNDERCFHFLAPFIFLRSHILLDRTVSLRVAVDSGKPSSNLACSPGRMRTSLASQLFNVCSSCLRIPTSSLILS